MTKIEVVEKARTEFAEEVSAAIAKLRDGLDLSDAHDVMRFLEVALGVLAFDLGYVQAIGSLCGADKITRDKIQRECSKAGMLDVFSVFKALGHNPESLKSLSNEIFPN